MSRWLRIEELPEDYLTRPVDQVLKKEVIDTPRLYEQLKERRVLFFDVPLDDLRVLPNGGVQAPIIKLISCYSRRHKRARTKHLRLTATRWAIALV